METIQSSLYALASGLCLFFFVLGRKRFGDLSLRYFFINLLLTAAGFTLEWLQQHPQTSFKAFWLGLMMCLSFLSAPCIWLYAKESVANQPPPLSSIGVWERGLLGIGILLLIPLLLIPFSSAEQRAEIFVFSRIHELMLMSILLYLIQVIIYLRRCLNILHAETRLSMALFSSVSDMPLAILRALIWVMAGNWLCDLARTLTVFFTDGPSLLYLLITICETSLICWAMYQIIESALRNGQTLLATEKQATSSTKYATYAMDNAAMQRIEQKILAAMEDQMLYQDSSLKLSTLSQGIGESSHYVSQVINQKLGLSFYELVNQHRIDAAKKRLLSHPDETILSIALEVGYNSKSTFNAAFKRLEKITPSLYREQRQANKQGAGSG